MCSATAAPRILGSSERTTNAILPNGGFFLLSSMGPILHSYLVIGALFIVGLLVSAVLHALLCLLSGMLGSTRGFGYCGAAGLLRGEWNCRSDGSIGLQELPSPSRRGLWALQDSF